MGTKKTILLTVLFLSFCLLTACSTSNSSKADPPGSETSQEDTNYELPERTPELQGKVKEIIGNEVTIFKMVRSEQQKTEKPTDKDSSPNKSGQNRFQVSTETESIIIPVGIPIVTPKMTDGKMTLQSVDITEIKKDAMLRIWIIEDGTVEFVQLSGNRQKGGKQQNQDEPREGRPRE